MRCKHSVGQMHCVHLLCTSRPGDAEIEFMEPVRRWREVLPADMLTPWAFLESKKMLAALHAALSRYFRLVLNYVQVSDDWRWSKKFVRKVLKRRTPPRELLKDLGRWSSDVS